MKYPSYILIVFFWLLIILQSFHSAAQNRVITGNVINGITGKPISKITIAVKGVKQTATSSFNGSYSLALPDTMEIITFSDFEGMDILEIKAMANDEINIYLTDINVYDLSLEELMKIKVSTAGKQEQQISEIPASVVLITREEIETYGYNTLEEILQSIPGFYMVEQYNWTGMSGFGVRGFFVEGSFSNLLIMVNGSTALREGYINQYILTRIGIPIEAIERIEIVRGPMSVMNGNGAFFGAINIITYTNQTDSKNRVTAMLGSNNTQKYALHIQTNKEDLSVAFNVGMYSTNGVDEAYTKMTSNPMVTMADSSQTSYLQSLGLSNNATTANQLSQDIKHFSITSKYKGFTFDVGTTRAEKGLLWIEPTTAPHGQNVLINGSNACLQYQQPIGETLELNALLTFGAYNSISRYNIGATAGAGFSHINSTNLFMEINGIYKPFENFDVTLGVVRETLMNASNDVDIPTFGVANSSWRIKLDDKLQDYEVYTQLNFNPIEKIHLIGGLRATKYGSYTYQRLIDEGLPTAQIFEKEFVDNEIHPTLRFAAIYKHNKNNIFKLMYGTAIISPNLRQKVTRLDLSGGDRSQLEPSSIATYEFSYSAVFSNVLYSTLSVFHNNIDKLIESSGATDADGNYIVITQNTGKIKTNGAELSLQIKPFNKLDIQLSATYQKSENMKEGWENITLGYSPELLGYIKVAYKINKKITLSLNGNYVDQMETSWQQKDVDPQIGARYGDKVPAYFCLNANILIKDIVFRGLFSNVYLSNITDTEIHYATDPSNQWADKGFIGNGRRVMFRIGYEF